jgi:DNA-binding CsgD family transcriptional regulator
MGMRHQPVRLGEDASANVEALGAFLLDLYRLAREAPLADFQERVLERLSEVLPFDAAWWGMSRLDRELHSSYPFRMPPHFVDYWCSIREHDRLAEAVIGRPGVTMLYPAEQIHSDPVFARFCARYRIRQSLCTLLMNPTLNLTTFLSLYRTRATPPFSNGERAFKQLVMPHLWAAWTSNWISQLASAHAHSLSSHVGLAVADQKGVLHAAEPRFTEMMQGEWTQWLGPQLPEAVFVALRAGEPVNARSLVIRLHPACGLCLIEARERSPLDRLTPRELAIAQRFGNGKSYKEIAAALPVSPATVRAHLRAIYTKLEISDKTELASLLSSHSEPAREPFN